MQRIFKRDPTATGGLTRMSCLNATQTQEGTMEFKKPNRQIIQETERYGTKLCIGFKRNLVEMFSLTFLTKTKILNKHSLN